MYARRIEPNEIVSLREVDPNPPSAIDEGEARERTKRLGKELADLQETLYAAGQHGLLIVLQGPDTSGKDGTIRNLSDWLNAQGMSVASFKVPTPKELAHDFLWRVHSCVPGRGEVTIFNRSHYEDVFVVRVQSLVEEEVWRRRYDHIVAFEKLLTDSRTIVLKFLLHISKEEQEERLLEREAEVEKAWKLNVGDWKEREYWDAYRGAFEEALSKCSTESAPWYVVPANKKWFRDLAVTEAIVEALRPYREVWMKSLEATGERARADLAAFRAAK